MDDYFEQLQYLLFSEDQSNVELAMELLKTLQIESWNLFSELQKCSEFFNQHFKISPTVRSLLYFLHSRQGHLNLANSNLQYLPTYLSALLGLVQHLDLSQNRFSQIPDCVAHFHNLKSLSFNQNPIAELPSSLFKLTNLEILTFAATFVYKIPDEIGQLKYLKKISFSNNIKTNIVIEKGFSRLHNLEFLQFDNCFHNKKAAVFEEQLFKLPNLRTFVLIGSDFIPPQITNFHNLETLILSDCNLDFHILRQLPILKNLFISRHSAKQIPVIQQNLPNVSIGFNSY